MITRRRAAHTRRPRGRNGGAGALAAAAAAAAVAAVALMAAGLVASGAGEAVVWWLFNAQPPAITAQALAGPRRGTLEVPVDVRPAGRAGLATVQVDGAEIDRAHAAAAGGAGAAPTTHRAVWWARLWYVLVRRDGPIGGETEASSAAVRIDTTALADGRHTLRLEAVDHSRRQHRTAVELAFTTDNTPPQLTLEASAPRVPAGRPALLRLRANEPAEIRATAGEAALPLLEERQEARGEGRDGSSPAYVPAYLALVAVPVHTAGGELLVAASGRDAAGNVGEAKEGLAIEPVPARRQALIVPPALAGLATGPVATAEAAQMTALTSEVGPERHWKGAFALPLPAAYARTTGFGERRDYADGYVAYHSGYDVAAPLGTPVLAAADGRIVFAGALQQRGNTAVVDHGWGVYTVYAHLAQIDAQAGQPVKQGQPLGLVGSTGLSTGPHLHWEVRLRGIPIDPDAWLALSRSIQ
ncbi:MAG: peptidoglycan DD-metalloendopeptidase family protein [Chloroflexi bacterium]|nr:peptidoglycan DD-metalloendopeptidase family protein [Chloroflexota bacterium]